MNYRIDQLVSAQVQRCPDGRAIVDGVSITYGELQSKSNQIANALIACGLQEGDRVCMLLPKSINAIVNLLGILKAGGTYVPLDIHSPPARLVRMLRTCGPSWLIAHPTSFCVVSQCLAEIGEACMPNLYWAGDAPEAFGRQLTLSQADIDRSDTEEPPTRVAANGLALIMFTSGSTGEPKGVPIKHEDLLQLFSWVVKHFRLNSEDRISCNAPLHFDSSLWDIFGALCGGAELHVVPAQTNLLPSSIAEFIRTSQLTQWASVPSVLTAMASRAVFSHGDFPELRRLIWYGEVFPIGAVKYWMERLPHVEFTNFYGPTEVTLVSLYHTLRTVPSGNTPVPIGMAVPGRRLAVLDSDDKPTDVDVIGNLCIGGDGLSPGYWRDADRTAVAYFEMPLGSGDRWYRTGDLVRRDAAGVFHFHGRADRQIKARGYRIELDEIAVALEQLTGIEESAVVAIPSETFGGNRICVAYVVLPGVERRAEELRQELAQTLPSYMLPSRWLAMNALPRNHNGKIDQKALERRFVEEE